jgi:hypothetical protein
MRVGYKRKRIGLPETETEPEVRNIQLKMADIGPVLGTGGTGQVLQCNIDGEVLALKVVGSTLIYLSLLSHPLLIRSEPLVCRCQDL